MVPGLSDARLDDHALVTQTLFRAPQRNGQLAQVAAAEVAQLDALEIVPDALVGVQLRRVAGQLLQLQASGSTGAQKVLDGLAAMDRRPIPDDQQLATEFAQQHAQKAHHIVRVIGSLLGLHEQATVGGDATDGGEMVVGEQDL